MILIFPALGFFITLYATLITLFGLIWVLFLIGWVNLPGGGRKYYIINVIDNVLVALFAIMGDGLAPFRVVDTYHMIFIAHYHHLTWDTRRRKNLTKLRDRNDLPPLPPITEPGELEEARVAQEAEAAERADAEARANMQENMIANGNGEAAEKIKEGSSFNPNINQFSVLTVKQQANLMHHQKKFSRSHTFYKPHETFTHHAFPLRFLVAIVVLLDCHSLLQIALGTCTWAISYHTRPFALTTVILCCSITVNITAGVLITIGDKRTRKKDVMERLHRQELTAEAMRHLEKKKERDLKKIVKGEDLSDMGHTNVLAEQQQGNPRIDVSDDSEAGRIRSNGESIPGGRSVPMSGKEIARAALQV
jgi:hypothetical protein